MFKGLNAYMLHIVPNIMIVFGIYEAVLNIHAEMRLEQDLASSEDSVWRTRQDRTRVSLYISFVSMLIFIIWILQVKNFKKKKDSLQDFLKELSPQIILFFFATLTH